jgi:hypothetical protein
LVIAGAVVFGSVYALNLMVAGGSALFGGPKRENWLVVPGVGPLVTMAQTADPGGNVLLAVDALAELSGIAMVTYWLAKPTPTRVESEAGSSFFTVTPMIGAGHAGALVVGAF